MVIHAVVTITGEHAALDACGARLRELLRGELASGAATERRSADALSYDLKVEGGIPFPVFAQASQAFPWLSFEAEWVNAETNERCSVTLVGGRATRQEVRKV